MTEAATRPVVWMRALRDGTSATGGTLNVLFMLALRMRKDGTGWVPQWQLVSDAGVSESTVRRALKWAQETGWIERTRRGHRINDDRSVASEYRLTLPPQPVTDDGLGSSPAAESQPVISEANRSNGQANRSPVTAQGVFSKGSVSTRVPPFGGATVVAQHPRDLYDHTLDELGLDSFSLGRAIAEFANHGEPSETKA